MTKRVERLKKAFTSAVRQADTERCVIATESSKNNSEYPEIIKRAKMLSDVLSNITITIREGELIVGNHAKELRGTPIFPEYATDWLSTQMDDFMTRRGDRFYITEEQKADVYKCLEYWKGISLRDRVMSVIPKDVTDALGSGVISNVNYTMSAPGHTAPYYKYLLETGFSGIRKVCGEKLAALDRHSRDFTEKTEFYNACIITCDAVMGFAARYAALAESMAAEEKDAQRKAELLKIAEVCKNVPANPAKSFYEALQFIYFVQLIIQLEGNGLAIAVGRLDRNVGALYEHDVKNGELNREDALELMECFYLKLNEIDKIYSNEATRALQGPAHGQTITVGGTDGKGGDVTNEVTYLVLEADRDIRLVQPDIAVRIHKGTPEKLLTETTQNVRSGLNKVKIFNDDVIDRAMKFAGFSDEDYFDYSFLGCSEPVVDGKTDSWGNSGHVNIAKCVELALNDGVCMLTGRQMGPHTGDPLGFKSIEDVKDAFKKQLGYFVEQLTTFDNMLDCYQARYAPLPFYSLVISDCVGRGVEFNAGGALYNTSSPLGIGPITAGDSLMAVKKMVFDEKKVSMEELISALKNDFKDNEPLRLMLQNRAPKYGNDIDEADEMSCFACDAYYDELAKYKNARGGSYIAGMYYLTANIPHGTNTAATPDGRHAGEPLNDGGVSPTHGTDKKGATAVMRSAGKLDNYRAGHGCVLNQLFHPSVFAGESSDEIFSAYMKGILDCGTWESQFNVITPDELREAQKHPEDYSTLVVRVAGYSAYFTALEKEMQDDIIDRTVLTHY